MTKIWSGAMVCIASLVAGCSALDDGPGRPRTAAVAIAATCGDGNLDPGEQCDDGNTADHDGCSAACTRELVTRFAFGGAAGTEATFAADLVDPELATTPVMSRGAGLIPSVAADAFSASGWTTGAAIDLGDFYSFTVTPAAGNAMNLFALQLDERRSGTGIRRWSVRSSLDGFATDIAVFSVPDDTLTRTQVVSLPGAFHDLTASVELRIFGFQAEAAGGTWRVDNVTLIGDVSPPDTAPPQLVAFTVSPLVVDTTAGPATVTVHIEATDDRSGFGSGSTGNGSIDVRHSSGTNPVGRGSLPITGGTLLHPSFDFTLTFPQASQPGSYPINLELIDNVFNHASFTPAALVARGMPSAIQVASPPDTTPPQLVAFTVSPLVVDTSAGPATVTVHIEATDDLSGFGSGSTGSGSIDVRHSSGTNPVGRGSLPITGGTLLHPSFDFTLTFPQFSQAGSYPISLELIDNVFNHASFTPAALAARGMPSAIQVTSASDTLPPQLVAFTVSPLVVDTSAGPATVTVHIEATDNLSGFGSGSTGSGSIDVRHSSGTNPVGRGSLPITGGTLLHPSFDFTLTFPQASQAGSYPINLELIDNVFNHASFTPAALAARGMPSAIQVTSP